MDESNDKRQYSIIDQEAFEWLEKAKQNNVDGLCLNKFKANFIVKDFVKNNYKVGDQIELDGKKCFITEIGKRCFGNECALFNKTKSACILKTSVAFASDSNE